MKKFTAFLIFIICGYLIATFADVYWMLAFIGLFMSFLLLTKKLPTSDALKLFTIVLSIVTLLLGGGVVIARNWGEFAAGIWVVFIILLYLIFLKKIKRLIPIFNVAEKFEQTVKEAENDLKGKNK